MFPFAAVLASALDEAAKTQVMSVKRVMPRDAMADDYFRRARERLGPSAQDTQLQTIQVALILALCDVTEEMRAWRSTK